MKTITITDDIETGSSKSTATSTNDSDNDSSTSSINGEEKSDIGSARTPWIGTSLVLLSEVMGTGILSLPKATVSVGWVAAMIAIPCFALFAAYSGYILAIVKQDYPSVRSFADAATQLVGPGFGRFTKACMLINWAALAIYFIVSLADSLRVISEKGVLRCETNRLLIAAVILIIPTQCRDFHAISKYLSLPSTIAIIVSIILVIISLVEDDNESGWKSFGETTTVGPASGTSPFKFLSSLSSFVFAFQGQSIYFEIMSEMKEPKKFHRANYLAYSIMAVAYALTVIFCYGIKGGALNLQEYSFLPLVMSTSAAKVCVGVFLALHVTVAYVIAAQPLHEWMHATIFPKTLHQTTFRGKAHWFGLTFGYIVFAFVMAGLIPFFGDIQELIGSLFGSTQMFGWPSLFFMLALKNKTENGTWKETIHSMGRVNCTVNAIFLFVLTPIFFIVGTIGAFEDIVADIGVSASPFQC